MVRSCRVQRRRRRWGKFYCDFGKSAKSCSVAKSCRFENSAGCLGNVLDGVSEGAKKAVRCIKGLKGCTSPDGCMDALKSRPKCLWESFGESAFSSAREGISSAVAPVLSTLEKIFPVFALLGRSLAGELLRSDAFSSSTLCMGRTFSLDPTDCDAFAHVKKFRFDAARRSLEQCASKKLLNFPTPFID